MSEYIATNRISQVVKMLYEQTGMSVFIECKTCLYQSSTDPVVSWKLTFLSPGNTDCKIRDFETYQEILDWIEDYADLISNRKHPVLL